MAFDFIRSAINAVMPAARATGLAVSLMTIEAPNGVLGPSGAPSGVFLPVAGLTGIVCMNAPQPPSEIKLGSREYRTPMEVTAEADRHVLCMDYYPTLETNWRYGARAVIDGIQYNVVGAESDSQHTQTRVALQVATFGAVQAP